jgi:hypothetical protein
MRRRSNMIELKIKNCGGNQWNALRVGKDGWESDFGCCEGETLQDAIFNYIEGMYNDQAYSMEHYNEPNDIEWHIDTYLFECLLTMEQQMKARLMEEYLAQLGIIIDYKL